MCTFCPFKKIVEKCRIKLLPLYIFHVIYYTCLGIIQFEITTQQHIQKIKRNSAKNKQAKQRSHVIFLICNDSIFFTNYGMCFLLRILYIHVFSIPMYIVYGLMRIKIYNYRPLWHVLL